MPCCYAVLLVLLYSVIFCLLAFSDESTVDITTPPPSFFSPLETATFLFQFTQSPQFLSSTMASGDVKSTPDNQYQIKFPRTLFKRRFSFTSGPRTFTVALAQVTDNKGSSNVSLMDNSSDSFNFTVHARESSAIVELYNRSENETYKVSYKIQDDDLSHHPESRSLIVHTNRFVLTDLLPGHFYSLTFFMKSGLVFTNFTAKPSMPLVVNDSFSMSTNELSFVMFKNPQSSQDAFLVELRPTSPDLSDKIELLKIQDADVFSSITTVKNITKFKLGGLKPGNDYNLTVKALKSSFYGSSWSSVVTTRPLPPTNVSTFFDLDDSLIVQWNPPMESGVDQYSLQFRCPGNRNKLQVRTSDVQYRLQLSNDSDWFELIPGERCDFLVSSIKHSMSSDEIASNFTLRPLPPYNWSLYVEYNPEHPRFVLSADLPKTSKQQFCVLNIDGIVHNLKAVASSDFTCSFFDVPLQPANSYLINISSQSDSVLSYPLTIQSLVVRPGFNFSNFGLSLLVLDKSVQLRWDRNRLKGFWKKVVGADGFLFMSIDNVNTSINPLESNASVIDGLLPGRCYEVEIFSVVGDFRSKLSYKISTRTLISPFKLLIDKVESRLAQLRIEFIDGLHVSVDNSCHLILSVVDLDTVDPSAIGQHQILRSVKTAAVFGDLKPFRHYDVFSEMTCYRNGELCEKQHYMFNTSFTTKQAKPGLTQSIWLHSITSTTAILEWAPPVESNGKIIGYNIFIELLIDPGNSDLKVRKNIYTVMDDMFQYQFTDLSGGRTYAVSVRAKNDAGLGPICDSSNRCAQASFTTVISAPPKPPEKLEILFHNVQSSTFTVSYNYSIFNSKHGILTAYSIIVAEGNVEYSSVSGDDQTWCDVQAINGAWPPYTAIRKPLPKELTASNIPNYDVVGAEAEVDCYAFFQKAYSPNALSNSADKLVINGPLKSSTPYKAKLRVFTAPHLYTDGDYSDVVITKASPSSGLVGPLLALLFALIVCVAAVFGIHVYFWSRGVDLWQLVRERHKRLPICDCRHSINFHCWSWLTQRAGLGRSAMDSQGTSNEGGTFADGSFNLSPGSAMPSRRQRSLRERANIDGRLERLSNCNTHVAVYRSVSGTSPNCLHSHRLPTVHPTVDLDKSRPVHKNRFAEHVRLMSADSDFRFSEEYEELKQVGRNQACSAADLPCNRNKNRFTNILPYDHNRVKLAPVDDDDGSDYINATFIAGFNSPREYIATQGPLPSTRDDFWRMVVEQNCSAIVNLTKCVEKGREKCDQYWPTDSQPVCYGNIEVSIMNETRLPDWTVRELKLNTFELSRSIRHYHFTAWPDFGVPDKPQTLVRFARAFRNRQQQQQTNDTLAASSRRPVLVHCSAGVGRSGTFIAIDRLLQRLAQDDWRLSRQFDGSLDRPRVQQHLTVNGFDHPSAIGSDYIDVFGVVYDMRKERVSMVQTEQQYICIHHCLLHAIECENKGGSNDDDLITSAYSTRDQMQSALDVHHNMAFDDDEGIAESGL